jgi:hypothetical protein
MKTSFFIQEYLPEICLPAYAADNLKQLAGKKNSLISGESERYRNLAKINIYREFRSGE